MVGGRSGEANGQARSGAKRPSSDQTPVKNEKRSRVSRACDQCRASREKCDGAQPTCNTCSLRAEQRECTYNEQPKKRGIQPNYIRTLELMLAWLFRTFPQTEARLAVGLPNADDMARKIINNEEATTAETFHQAWRNGIIFRQIDQILSGTTVESWSSDYQPQAPIDSTESSIKHQQPTVVSERPSTAGSRLQLPDTAWDLLEYYFAFTQSWLPMTEKPSILKLMYSYPPEGILRGDSGTAVYAELWSILALAEAQTTAHGQTSTKLYDMARSLLPSDFGSYEISHVKALLVLGLVEITKRKWLAAWLFIGAAIRVLTAKRSENGRTSLDGSSSLFPPFATPGSYDSTGDNQGLSGMSPLDDGSRLKNVTLAAFVLEAAVASELNAPAHLRPSQVAAVGLLDEDGLEEWSPWHDPHDQSSSTLTRAPSRCYSTFNNLVRMAIARFDGNGTAIAMSSSDNIVLALAQNASRPQSRMQPTILVGQYQAGTLPAEHRPDTTSRQHAGSTSIQSPPTFFSPDQTSLTTDGKRQLPFMSIPNEGSESGFTGSPSIPTGSNALPDLWDPDTPRNMNSSMLFPDSNLDQGPDIFEELALLERNDSSQNPQFMQNLGFAPDLDLAEFFGADYQPSDPMLAYIQPSAFGAPQGNGRNGGDSNK